MLKDISFSFGMQNSKIQILLQEKMYKLLLSLKSR